MSSATRGTATEGDAGAARLRAELNTLPPPTQRACSVGRIAFPPIVVRTPASQKYRESV